MPLLAGQYTNYLWRQVDKHLDGVRVHDPSAPQIGCWQSFRSNSCGCFALCVHPRRLVCAVRRSVLPDPVVMPVHAAEPRERGNCEAPARNADLRHCDLAGLAHDIDLRGSDLRRVDLSNSDPSRAVRWCRICASEPEVGKVDR